MGKVLLPYVEPMYSTYHWLASAGIPAKQNDTSDNWYYNNTVEWRCTRKFLQGFTTPEMGLSAGGLWNMPFWIKAVLIPVLLADVHWILSRQCWMMVFMLRSVVWTIITSRVRVGIRSNTLIMMV